MSILNLNDKIYTEEKHIIQYDNTGKPKNRILFIDDNTGEILREETNMVVIAGAQLSAMKHFGLDELVPFPNYNTELGITNISGAPENEEIACLFCCGNNGCGMETSQVYPVKYNSRIHPNNLVPFRYERSDNDLPSAQRSIYFGRKEITELGRVAYYYKAFDSEPQLHIKYTDNTQIDSNVYNISTSQKAVTYVEMRLKITVSDFRDYYINTTGLENSRINQLSILTGWKKTAEDGFVYYQNVRPLTLLNFTNEWLMDLSKAISIVYQMYY